MLGVASFGVYVASSGTRPIHFHAKGHYVTLAQWMLEGRLSAAEPVALDDMVERDGRFYIVFPPLPALMMMPLLAIAPRHVNPVLFTAVFGAANVVLMAAFLRRALPRLGVLPATGLVRWLTVGFALGTVHWYSASAGSVWYTSQVCGLTFLLLAAWEATGRGRPALCGFLLALAMCCRPPLAFALPFFAPVIFGLPSDRRLAATLRLAAPLTVAVGLLALLNYARFGSLTDFGYTSMKVGGVLKPHLERGLFALGHFPRNVYYGFLHMPELTASFPHVKFDPMGNSLFLVSPFLAGVFLAGMEGIWRKAAWGAMLLVCGVDLLYFSSGFAQFGYRYSLDFAPFIVLLAAGGIGRAAWFPLRALVVAAVTLNFLGMVWILNWARMGPQVLNVLGLG